MNNQDGNETYVTVSDTYVIVKDGQMTKPDGHDTLYRCTICGRIGTVGRCCGMDTREPLNYLARAELEAGEKLFRSAFRATEHLIELAKCERDEAETRARQWEIACAIAISGWLLTLAWGLCK